MILGLAFAVAVGVGFGILRESVDSSVHSARELQAAFAIPVLAAIPKILLESDLAALRRSRIKLALDAFGVIGFALVGGAANYLWVNGSPGFFGAESTLEAPIAVEVAPTEPGIDVGAGG